MDHGAVVTSGDYEKFVVLNGVKKHLKKGDDKKIEEQRALFLISQLYSAG